MADSPLHNDEAAFKEVMNAMQRLRVAFLKCGMNVPVSIELGTVRDGDIFRHRMPREYVLAQPRMGETKADAEWVANMFGIEVRMPAQWRRERDGKVRLAP